MVLKFIAIAFLAVAATRLHAESPIREFRDGVIGQWEVASSERNGKSHTNPTIIETVVVDKNSIRLVDTRGGERRLDYQLLLGETGWAIDLYRRGGKADAILFPSRIDMHQNRWRVLLPLNDNASHSRPDSFDTSVHRNWILLELKPAESSLSSATQPDRATAGLSQRHSNPASESASRSDADANLVPPSIDAGMMADDLGRMQRLGSSKVLRSIDLIETNPRREK
ncbi:MULTISPECIES: hypothetical protein [Rhodopirellula]|uniref:hypothetical protein n=1 Tax=Rhodopirellula TaxID=265488 RepID=UPI00257A2053|nr:hypothetical protein [Rhodopirellula sp. UBA1907]